MGVLEILAMFLKLGKNVFSTKTGVYILAGALGLSGAVYSGWHYRGLIEVKAQKDAIDKALKDFEEVAKKDDRWVSTVEIFKDRIVTEEKVIYRDALKTDLCVDNKPTDKFKRLYNIAVRSANKETSSNLNDPPS